MCVALVPREFLGQRLLPCLSPIADASSREGIPVVRVKQKPEVYKTSGFAPNKNGGNG
jgi:hypothetical protein